MKTVASEPKRLDGYSPSSAILDEITRIETTNYLTS